MDVSLLYFDDCPNWRLAESRLNEALTHLGDDAPTLTYQLVTAPEQAVGVEFRGSPTILVNGRDPFAGPDDPIGFSCRMYRGPAGVDYAPTVDQMRAALLDALGRGRIEHPDGQTSA
ncbi:MAG: DUF2703 domain-containing protein [Actinomycetota bacterium]|nr:DUF2703 domain-containing protein [Actinomycetota bacterium]